MLSVPIRTSLNHNLLLVSDCCVGVIDDRAAIDAADHGAKTFTDTTNVMAMLRRGAEEHCRRGTRSILQTLEVTTGGLAEVGDIEFNGVDIAGITS